MNNGLVTRSERAAGSSTDMTLAYIIRGVTIVLVAGALKLAWETRDDTRDLKHELPKIIEDISALKEQGKSFATKKELDAAEQRVKQEFADQIKKGTTVTKGH